MQGDHTESVSWTVNDLFNPNYNQDQIRLKRMIHLLIWLECGDNNTVLKG